MARAVTKPGFRYYSGNDTIDLEISRIGAPISSSRLIKNPEEYTARIASALIHDTAIIENRNPGYTNVILCGGMDSLNLLFLPWKNPVLVASAPPNYEIVKTFLSENGLPYDIVALDDQNDSLIEPEILINCCRNNLQHCRWGYQLRQIARDLHGRVIFWKGQLGASFMTPYWKIYTHPRIVGVVLSHILGFYRHFRDPTQMMQRYFFQSLWLRGAMRQGVHMSFLRHLTGAMCLSAYHGEEMRRVLSEVDLSRAVPYDIRPLLGASLASAPIRCPSSNPSPGLSVIRKNKSHLAPFLETVKHAGIPTTI